jgi:hypothetical protein
MRQAEHGMAAMLSPVSPEPRSCHGQLRQPTRLRGPASAAALGLPPVSDGYMDCPMDLVDESSVAASLRPTPNAGSGTSWKGVDIPLVETSPDVVEANAPLAGVRRLFRTSGSGSGSTGPERVYFGVGDITAAGVIVVPDQAMSATPGRLRPGGRPSLGTQPQPRASDDGAVRL